MPETPTQPPTTPPAPASTPSLLQRVQRSVAVYPVTVMYVVGVLVAIGVAANWFSRNVGIVVLTVFAITIVLVALTREIRVVHHLVNSQRDELLLRIDNLIDALQDAGVELPPGEKKGKGVN